MDEIMNAGTPIKRDSEYAALRRVLGTFQADLRKLYGCKIAMDPDTGDFIVVVLNDEFPGGFGLVFDSTYENLRDVVMGERKCPHGYLGCSEAKKCERCQ